jgi:hypothetical protein
MNKYISRFLKYSITIDGKTIKFKPSGLHSTFCTNVPEEISVLEGSSAFGKDYYKADEGENEVKQKGKKG